MRKRTGTQHSWIILLFCLMGLVYPIQTFSQGTPLIKIKGNVTDSSGEPLIGATIQTEGGKHGTATDINGNFAIEAEISSHLEISYIGYETQTVFVSKDETLKIVLKEDSRMIDEVVVLAYGTMKKSDINAAIVSVKSEDLIKTSSPDVSEMLMGRAAGLTVTQNSAKPGGGIDILVRGAASTGAGNEPLYVIDGFPMVNASVSPETGSIWTAGSTSPLSDINPNDIESIEILKDASATAIYGARGANGVILITTKRGTKDTKVEYSMNTSVQSIIKRPDLLTAEELMIEQMRYDKEIFLRNNKIYPYGYADPSLVNYVPKVYYTDEEIVRAGKGTNWYDEVTRMGLIQQQQLSVSFGNNAVKSLVSFNLYDQEGVVKTSEFTRFSLRYNLDHKVTEWLDYGISSMASRTTERNAALGGGRDKNAGILEAALSYSPMVQAERDPLTGSWIEDPNQALLNHPLSYLDITDNTITKRYLATAFANFHIVKNELWIKLSGGADIRNGLRQAYYPMSTKHGNEVGGDANISTVNRDDYNLDAVLNYQKTFAERHRLISLIGYSYQEFNRNSFNARATDFMTDDLLYYDLAAGEERPVVGSSVGKHIIASYFARVQYAFDNRYLFTVTGRIDGSDRFGDNNKHAFFPSAAFAWRFNQEKFADGLRWLSDGKLRLSMGQVGNENLPNDAASEYYAFNGHNYYWDGELKKGMDLNKFGNPNLKWETTTEYNLGVDFGFFKNRISGNIDIFYKEVKDLLSERALPHTAIKNSVYWNVGKTESKGLEATLHTINLEGPLFWQSTFTFTSYRDKWKERDPKVMLPAYVNPYGAIGSIYTLLPDGIMQPGESVSHMPNLEPGQIKYKDVNGKDANGNLTGIPDGMIDDADLVYLGTRRPEFTTGLNNSLRYKGFDLSFFFYASVGAYKWASTNIEHGVYGGYGLQRISDSYNFLSEVKNRWTSDNMYTTMASGFPNSYESLGAPHWQKSSYLRLKNLSLGYDLGNILSTQKLNMRVYISAQNLFTLTNYNGFDPEVENDRATYPQQRTFSLGLDVKF
ncbi:SusC/RagA family TonB-linked outer membrane protein [Proteiniphilum sp. UBA5384]|uniref:SusC/RagA family TonB-linked outer membrane protein n=1 Tax=Proteiniphilum sp. UBA5384 TaxID=1947279 RepID=UPI0025F81541|nr:TonB-dependent receptor [Proteiniphilum sp. UBA5384]